MRPPSPSFPPKKRKKSLIETRIKMDGWMDGCVRACVYICVKVYYCGRFNGEEEGGRLGVDEGKRKKNMGRSHTHTRAGFNANAHINKTGGKRINK